jgi:type IV secretion system protein VirB8
MNDIPLDFSALPILDPERAQYHKAVRSFQGHTVIDIRRRARSRFWLSAVFLSVMTAEAITIATLLPLKRVEPLLLLVHNDGTVDSGVSLSDLGSTWPRR